MTRSTRMDDVVQRARAASAAWSAVPIRQRLAILRRARLAMVDAMDAIVATIREETSKPALDALSGDLLVTLEFIRYCERNAVHALRPLRIASEGPLHWFTTTAEHYRAHGAVLVVSPWNYPVQLAFVPAITAIVAGNGVILKPSEQTPRTADLVRSILVDAGLPPDVLQIVHGDAAAATAIIDAVPDFIFATGGTAAGRSIAARAALHLIPCVLELGGNDAMIVCEDADIERAARAAVYALCLNAGQVCVSVKRLFVHAPVADALVHRMATLLSERSVGVTDIDDVAPMTRDREVSIARDHIEDALRSGAVATPSVDIRGRSIRPLILTNIHPDARILHEETFAPVLPVVVVASDEEAIARANDGGYGLSASVWSRSRDRAMRIAAALRTGSCSINDVIRHVANPAAPFGGTGRSGYGRYKGLEGFRTFSRRQTVMRYYGFLSNDIAWFPHTRSKFEQLRKVIMFRHGGLTSFKRLFLGALALLATMSITAWQDGGGHTLTVRVQNFPNAEGVVRYCVFTSDDGFPRDVTKALRSGTLAPPASGELRFTVQGLTQGDYAVSVYHDANNNRELDKGLFGIPKEAVGASNNPRPRFGPPDFDDTRFRLGTKDTTIIITLVQP
ncbi:MAG: hypothetical protein BGO89_08235 [Candidatus Kapaibacterium thiocyanatum]|uniref:Aldehyde dehydrogenase domain-containing protein n=1 Tax=Candidatus Kapaibacterium thiocyanatum TaxID=1895771 RepID=A0A1M3L3Q0_9BACT|nr:MAG: hypothetical protein BGO89_08235 ['Candidatus Kapabacteria' thiocyanatum]